MRARKRGFGVSLLVLRLYCGPLGIGNAQNGAKGERRARKPKSRPVGGEQRARGPKKGWEWG